MGLNISAHRPVLLFPPTSGVAPPEQTRAPRVDAIGVTADFVVLEESPHRAPQDEYVAIAPGTHPYQWKFGARESGSSQFGYDRRDAFQNHNRFNPNSTLYGVNGTAGADPVAKCRQMLIS